MDPHAAADIEDLHQFEDDGLVQCIADAHYHPENEQFQWADSTNHCAKRDQNGTHTEGCLDKHYHVKSHISFPGKSIVKHFDPKAFPKSVHLKDDGVDEECEAHGRPCLAADE